MFRKFKRPVAFCLALAVIAGFIPALPQQPALAFGEEGSILMVVAGHEHTIALLDDSSVWAWGNNQHGQVGDGTNFTRTIPVMVIPPSTGNPVVAIAAGADHSFAVLSSGELLAWGNNRNGQLGDGTTASRNRPVNVKNDDGSFFTVDIWNQGEEPMVSAGLGHSTAISGGKLYTWGQNNLGQLGLGDNRTRTTPTLVEFVYDEISVDGMTPEEIRENFGVDVFREFKDGIAKYYEPVECDAELVAAGNSFTIAVLNGALYSFGSNVSGQLGHNDTVNRNRPMFVPGYRATAFEEHVEISPTGLRAGTGHAMALEGTTLYAWGSNEFGQIALTGTDKNVLEPVIVRDDVHDAQGGYHHTVMHLTDNTVFIQGMNSRGQMGNGLVETVKNNHLVVIDDPEFEYDFDFDPENLEADYDEEDFFPEIPQVELDAEYIISGYYYSGAVSLDGDLWFWGENGYGQLGDATVSRRLLPFNLPKKVFYEEVVPVRTVTSNTGNVVYVGLGYKFGKVVTVTVNPSNAIYTDIKWEIGNSDIAKYIPLGSAEDDDGNMTHSIWVYGNTKTGQTELTATAYNGKKVTMTVKVQYDPEYVEFTSKPSRIIALGNSFLLKAAVQPMGTYDRTLIWALFDDIDSANDHENEGDEDNGFARIEQDGRLYALESTLEHGPIYVRAQSKQNPEVFAVVPVECGIFAVKSEIYAYPYDESDLETPPLRTVTLYIDRDEDGVENGGWFDLHAINQPYGLAGYNVTWRSEASTVCKVEPDPDEPGRARIIALKPGTTTITATSTDRSGTSAKITVNVVPLGHYIELLSPRDLPRNADGLETVSVKEGARITFKGKVWPNKSSQKLFWSVEDEFGNPSDIGAIDSARGVFTGLKEGSCIVVARTYDRDFGDDPTDFEADITLNNPRVVELRIAVNVIRPITGMVLVPKSVTVTLGADDADKLMDTGFTCLIIPSSATIQDLVWSSSNVNAAYFADSEDAASLVIHGTGTTKITAMSTDGTGRKATASLKVMSPPERVRLDRASYSDLAVGKSLRLKATVDPSSASQLVTWYWEGPVTVDENGRVTAIGATEEDEPALVWAIPRGVDPDDWDISNSDICEITTVIKVSSFKVTPARATVLSDSEVRFKVDILPFMASRQGITMTSPHREITAAMSGDTAPDGQEYLEMDDDGYITLVIGDVRGGPFTVNLTCDGKRATVRLTIKDAPEGINIEKAVEYFDARENMIMKGKSVALKDMVFVEPLTADQGVIWYSSSDAVARVDAKGTVRGMGPGTVEIWCETKMTAEDGTPLAVSDKIELECVVPVNSVKLSPSGTVTLIEGGEPVEVDVLILPYGAYLEEEWDVTVSGRDGVVEADKTDYSVVLTPGDPGNATVNVIHEPTGKRATLRVVVKGNPDSVVLSTTATERTLRKGSKFALRARVLDSDGNMTPDQKVFWESEDESIVKISSSGAITVVGPGTATVWAWTFNAAGEEVLSDTFTIHTVIPVSGIGITPNVRSVTVNVGESVEFDCETKPFLEAFRGVNENWLARSSRPAVASVPDGPLPEDADGRATLTITGESAGAANVTLRVGGKSVIISVIVKDPG